MTPRLLSAHLLTAMALAALVTGCGKPAEDRAPATPAAAPTETAEPATPATSPIAPPSVALDQEGLRLVTESGSTRLIAFNTPTADAVSALSTALDAPADRSTNSECGAGPTEFVSWPNALDAMFLDGKFVGWSLGSKSDGKVTTMDGIGVGSSRQALTAAFGDLKVEQSTLGVEFSAGDIFGILDKDGPAGKVETIWGGLSCVFR